MRKFSKKEKPSLFKNMVKMKMDQSRLGVKSRKTAKSQRNV